jgi:hypothetical protein
MMKNSRLLLKMVIATVLSYFCQGLAHAQSDTSFRHLPDAKQRMPLYVVNDTIISSSLDFVNPANIQSIEVLKDGSKLAPRLKNLTSDGIIYIHFKKQIVIKTKSFTGIKDWLGITADVKFALDGYYVDDTSLVIATEAIYQVDVIKILKQNVQVPDVINVWTLPPAARKGFAPGTPHPTDKPGEIYIR